MKSLIKDKLIDVFIYLYKVDYLRNVLMRSMIKYEKGTLNSVFLRKILHRYFNIKIGKYSYGDCLLPGGLPRGTIIGRYCSIASNLNVFRRNHPANHMSLHPFFYNTKLGFVDESPINQDEDNPLVIGNDVWIGQSVIITPACKYIGDGAIIGAGSVVTRNVNNFDVVAGNPAKLIRKRFSDDEINIIESIKWWEMSVDELQDSIDYFISEFNTNDLMDLKKKLDEKN